VTLIKSVKEIVAESKNPLLSRHSSWERVDLIEISEILNGFAFKSKFFNKKMKGFPILRIRDVGKDHTDAYYSRNDHDEKYIVKKGDLIVGMDGDFRSDFWKGPDALLNQRVCKISITTEFYSLNFLSHVLQGYLDEIHKNTSAVTVKHLSSRDMDKIPLPLPPFNEQVRIVGRVEELFSRLDAGVRSLQAAQTQLEQYRQTTLEQAYTGQLTQSWRKSSITKQNSSRNLLEKIEDFREQNKIKKPRKLPQLDTSELIKIPENWLWVQINDITSEIQYGTSKKANYNDTGIPVLRMGNIQNGKLDYTDLKYFDPSSTEALEFLLTEGDILFNRTNSAELVGKTALYHDFYPTSIFASYLICVKIFKDFIMPEIISEFINSVIGKNYIAKVRSQQVGQANVNGTKLAAMPIPLIPYGEQEKILEILDTVNSNLINIQNEIDRSTKQADFLKQSILKKAFEGRLVPQDPEDEPASVLLERIKAKNMKQRKLF